MSSRLSSGVIPLTMALAAFLPFYIPIRFYFGLHSVVPLGVMSAEALLLVASVLWLTLSLSERLTRLDLSVLAFSFYTFLLIAISDGMGADQADALRRYFLPMTLYWPVAYFFDGKNSALALRLILAGATIVGLFYFAELVNSAILKQGYLDWTMRLKDFQVAHGAAISESRLEFGSTVYYRLVGFLGHNHATSYFMAFGCLGHLILSQDKDSRGRWWHWLSASFLTLTTLLALGKTAVAATVLGFGLTCFYIPTLRQPVYLWLRNRVLLGVLAMVLFAVAAPAFADILGRTFRYFLFDSIKANVEINVKDSLTGGLLGQVYSSPLTLLTGAGFVNSASVPPTLSDDFFPVELISRYGIIGLALLVWMLFEVSRVRKAFIKVPELTLSAALPPLYIFTMLVMMSHSSMFFYHQLYAYFFVMLGMVRVWYFAPDAPGRAALS